MRIEKSAILLAIAAGLAVMIAAAAMLHYRAVAGRKEALRSLNDELLRAQHADAATARALALREQMRDSLAQFVQQVPEEMELGPLLGSLGAEPGEEAILEGEISTRASVAGHYLTRTPLSIRSRGSFESMFLLLERIESAPQLVRVDRIVIERPAGDLATGQTPRLQVEIDFSAFSRNSPELSTWAIAE